MSQVTARVLMPGRPSLRPAQGTTLRLIRGTVDRPRSGVFAASCFALIVAGFLGVLFLNTAMAKGAFVMHDLQRESNRLADSQDALAHSISAKSAPAVLAQRALGLGMVPSSTAAFLDLKTGRVLGVAQPAVKPKGFSVITSPAPGAAPAGPRASAAAVPTTPEPPVPTKTVLTKGTVTTTTEITTRADGSVMTVVTVVDTSTGTTTTSTTIAKAAPAPATPAAKPATTPATQPTTAPTAAVPAG